ncbi:hypothetical protein AVEN_182333-1 [Araneus ventricosus]|uniref:Uncharacterized protein n=1 Tax=Araneus ventricosus TaxID=182803 RepID=A0A4Y2KAA0_ARAVE|nr:hypothetical protein AVEN_182333-1 [Araneus ventricosus]
MEDPPPRQIVRHCVPRIIASITRGSCDDPPFYRGYDLYSEMGPKSHTTITVPTGEASSCLQSRQQLISEYLRRHRLTLQLLGFEIATFNEIVTLK